MPAWWEHLLHIVIGRISRHEDLPDLRGLASRPVALERTHYLVNDRERQSQDRRAYVLRSEPATRRDPVSVTVTSNGRGVGYLPVPVAQVVQPLLERVGGAAIVNGAGTKNGSIRLWVDLPTDSALREFIHGGMDDAALAAARTATGQEAESDRERFAHLSRRG